MAHDRYGPLLSTVSAAATLTDVEGVERLPGAPDGAEECFGRALIAGRGSEGRVAAAQARALVFSLDGRERQHVEALATAAAGQGVRAVIREPLAEFPCDAVTLAVANEIHRPMRFNGRQEHNEDLRVLPGGVASAYGQGWWFLSAQGVVEHARDSLPTPGLAFADVHRAVALAADGDREGMDRRVQRPCEHTLLPAYLRTGRGPEAEVLSGRGVDRRPSVPVAGA
jgi:hypothetical protein